MANKVKIICKESGKAALVAAGSYLLKEALKKITKSKKA